MPGVVADWSAVVRPRDVQKRKFLGSRCSGAVEFRVEELVDRKRSGLTNDLRLLCAQTGQMYDAKKGESKVLLEPNGPNPCHTITGHWAVLISDAFSQTPVDSTDTGLVHRVMRLFTPQPLGRYQVIPPRWVTEPHRYK